MRVAFRVDAAPHIGSGHLMRCLTLADALKARGCETHFLGRPLPASARTQVESRQHQWHDIAIANPEPPEPDGPRHAAWLGTAQREDAAVASRTLSSLQPEWLVVDHYALDRRWEQAVRPRVGRVMVIDDLADRDHDCDLLLDQNYHRCAEQRYDGHVPRGCRRLLGPRYALLRPEFTAARARRRGRDGSMRRLLISLGGADAANITAVALDAALRLPSDCEIDVVVGAAYQAHRELAERCASLERVRVHVQTDRMGELMAAADIAVGAAGSSAWERLCLGLPTVTVAIADNQVPGLTSLCEAGLTIGTADPKAVTADTLFSLLQALHLAPAFSQGMAERGMRLVDGDGCRRVADAMLPPVVGLRRAGPDDCESLFEWRNDPSVRASSHDPGPIRWDSHQRWFADSLNDGQRILLIGFDASGPVGVLRYDLRDVDATVSVYLVPSRQGQHLGVPLLQAGTRWVRRHHPHIAALVASILPGNRTSIATFSQAGYVPDHLVYVARLGDTPP
ncbi:MAG: UDP-2,4-diacetamido-2,4,6-trideoxy-beta-L-altropyranose hydrolase [Burkholderiaceae bacterium]|nr:UDP-2,4-diacetamido-2,4,6-trideoxy-beta-L-altropyranose hydrolase [Burkholderiaceae bacterium]